MRNRLALAFLTMLAAIVTVLGIPKPDDYHEETDKEFMDRICAGIYLTSDTEIIEAGEAGRIENDN